MSTDRSSFGTRTTAILRDILESQKHLLSSKSISIGLHLNLMSTSTFDHVWFVSFLNRRMEYLMGYHITKHQHDPILVVVDRFSSMDILAPCKKTTTTYHISQLFFEHAWKHYGLPTTIISERDAIFVSTFWKTLWKQLDMRLSLSTSFHS